MLNSPESMPSKSLPACDETTPDSGHQRFVFYYPKTAPLPDTKQIWTTALVGRFRKHNATSSLVEEDWDEDVRRGIEKKNNFTGV